MPEKLPGHLKTDARDGQAHREVPQADAGLYEIEPRQDSGDDGYEEIISTAGRDTSQKSRGGFQPKNCRENEERIPHQDADRFVAGQADQEGDITTDGHHIASQPVVKAAYVLR